MWVNETQVSDNIGGVMVSMLASGQTKDYRIGICCFSAKHAALRSKSKDWLAWHQNNMSEWSDMSIRGLLFQCVGLEHSGPHHHLIEN